MKFRVARDILSEAVQWTARVVPTRPAVPILAGVRISASDGVLDLSSFDYEVSARGQIEAEVEEPGDILVPGRLLAEIARALPNRDVTVSQTDGHIEIRCGNAGFQLTTMSLDDYPRIPELPALQGTVNATTFARAIQQVVIAASNEESLPLLTATRIEIDGAQMTLMATDRYRLALKEIEWSPTTPDFTANLLVKSRILADVAKSMAAGGDIEIHLSEGGASDRSSMIGFSAGDRGATSVLMDGDYPPVRKLFPETTPLEYACNRQELLEATKRVALVADRNTSVRLTFADGALMLEAGQGEGAQARESVEMLTDCEDIQTAFNPDYFQAGLAACDTEYVRFGFTHPTKAAVLRGQPGRDDPADDSFRYLLMPIRFGG